MYSFDINIFLRRSRVVDGVLCRFKHKKAEKWVKNGSTEPRHMTPKVGLEFEDKSIGNIFFEVWANTFKIISKNGKKCDINS